MLKLMIGSCLFAALVLANLASAENEATTTKPCPGKLNIFEKIRRYMENDLNGYPGVQKEIKEPQFKDLWNPNEQCVKVCQEDGLTYTDGHYKYFGSSIKCSCNPNSDQEASKI